jgi:hypothetical protein
MREGKDFFFVHFFCHALLTMDLQAIWPVNTGYLALFALSLSGVAEAAHYLHAFFSPSLQLMHAAARLVASS